MRTAAMLPLRIDLIRHALCDPAQWSTITTGTGNRYSGGEDPPLSELGIHQAEALGRFLQGTGQPPDTVLSSTLSRAIQTAEIACRHAGWDVEIIQTHLLIEQGQGTLTNLKDEEAKRQFPDLANLKYQQGFWFFKPPAGNGFPEGESWSDIVERLRPVAQNIREHAGERIIIFGHSTANQCLRLLLEELTPQEVLAIDERRILNCSITTLQNQKGKFKPTMEYFQPPEVTAAVSSNYACTNS
jgi:broad specificity phosphatase PhoE